MGGVLPFNEDKLRAGMLRALEKRPVSVEQIETAIARLLRKVMTSGEREIPSSQIGEWVMEGICTSLIKSLMSDLLLSIAAFKILMNFEEK